MKFIRVESMEHLEACLAIRREVFVGEQQVPLEEEMDDCDRTPESCHHVLIEIDGDYAATARWQAYDSNTAKFQRIAVRKNYRGQGLGRILVLGMEDQAQESGYQYAMLDAQCQAEKFYQKLGYETLPIEPFYDAGILHVRMAKALSFH